MFASHETTIWSTDDGVRCVVRQYDDKRYQLRLLRAAGTVKADLFAEYEEALAVAENWRRHFVAHAHETFMS